MTSTNPQVRSSLESGTVTTVFDCYYLRPFPKHICVVLSTMQVVVSMFLRFKEEPSCDRIFLFYITSSFMLFHNLEIMINEGVSIG
mmetsp:Transcript_2423/g.4191  ORF Transcript_2423/g.4191 Transcript_2423/m.4191 type:complete len:86 (+) Transcript_2423:50-307(+)